MTGKRQISRDDILPADTYAEERAARRKASIELKRRRRVEVGPFATFFFESYATMWTQIHEMLHIERGGEAQIAGELEAYNPLIPNGKELVATVMLEIADAERRARILATLGGIEHRMFLRIGDDMIRGDAEDDSERTNAAGKASSVLFVRFRLTEAQIAAWHDGHARAILGIDHENYDHMAVIAGAIRQSLGEDLDPV